MPKIRTQHNVPGQGLVSRKNWEHFGPAKPLQNLEPYDHRAVYSHVLNMNRGSLHTRSLRRVHFSVFRCRLTKNGFTGPKNFRDVRETGPEARTRTALTEDERANHEATAPPHAMLYGKETTLSQPLIPALKINNFISSWRLQVSGCQRFSALQSVELLLCKKKLLKPLLQHNVGIAT